MKGLIRVALLTIGTALLLAVFTSYDGNGDAMTTIFGLPVVSARQFHAHGWLAIGQTGSGVLVIAQGGAGVVAFVQGGAGLLFGIGQGMVSLASIAQLGVGVFGFVGQVGFGAQAIGQGVARRVSTERFKELSAELDELLSWSGR